MPSSTLTTAQEVWELVIPGRVTVTVNGEFGQPRDVTAKGEGQRIRLTTDQRRVAEEVIRERVNNPFRNGMMYQVNREQLEAEAAAAALEAGTEYVRDERDEPSDDELPDSDLENVFGLGVDDGSFGDTVRALSEVNVRRLAAMAPRYDAKASQVAFLQDFIRETYVIGGDTPTYQEMQAVPASAV